MPMFSLCCRLGKRCPSRSTRASTAVGQSGHAALRQGLPAQLRLAFYWLSLFTSFARFRSKKNPDCPRRWTRSWREAVAQGSFTTPGAQEGTESPAAKLQGSRIAHYPQGIFKRAMTYSSPRHRPRAKGLPQSNSLLDRSELAFDRAQSPFALVFQDSRLAPAALELAQDLSGRVFY